MRWMYRSLIVRGRQASRASRIWLYTDPDVLALEQKRLFEGPVWNFLCLETELTNIGDYRTTFVGAMPVVVARAEDGELCAFENRCAHRGALICLDDGGR